MYYTVIKHSGHLRTLEKCRKHSPAARVFYISLVFSNVRRVLSQCNTRLRLLYLLNIVTKKNCTLFVVQKKLYIVRGSSVFTVAQETCTSSSPVINLSDRGFLELPFFKTLYKRRHLSLRNLQIFLRLFHFASFFITETRCVG